MPQAALYCLEEEEAPLLQYIANARDLLGKPLYDPQTALRLARQRNKLQACVQLLCDLNLYEVRASSLITQGQLVIMLCFGMKPSEGLSVRHLTKSVQVKQFEGADDLCFTSYVGRRISVTENSSDRHCDSTHQPRLQHAVKSLLCQVGAWG